MEGDLVHFQYMLLEQQSLTKETVISQSSCRKFELLIFVQLFASFTSARREVSWQKKGSRIRISARYLLRNIIYEITPNCL